MQIAVVFQQRQNQVADFTELKGTAAGRRAYRHAHDSIGQPPGSVIYFSVDFDASPDEIDNNITPYFKGIKRAFDEESAGSSEYRLGAYGSGLVCRGRPAGARLGAASVSAMVGDDVVSFLIESGNPVVDTGALVPRGPASNLGDFK